MTKKIVLFAALCLVVLAGCNKKTTEPTTTEPTTPISVGEKLPIAIINVDSILNQYDFAIDANEKLMSKQEDLRVELNQEAVSLQNEMATFQKKMDNNAFLSRERAESEYNRIARKEQALQQKEQVRTQELVDESTRLNIQLRDSLKNAISILNADGRYHLILSNSSITDNVLFAAPEYDITVEVIDLLNERYSKAGK